MEDLTIVVPGILGTRLVRRGKPVWPPLGRGLWAALKSGGGSLQALALPPDFDGGDPRDGVEPDGLVRDLQGLPGLGPFVRGYSDLVGWLRGSLGLRPATATAPGNLVEFGYDWRRSNRHSAERLAAVAKHELKRWRDDRHPDAKLVLYCHSMGGLVARYFLEALGGAEDTRALVTVGTPHRGSLKALTHLVNETAFKLGPFELNVTELTRSFPSVYELLPTYACIVVDGDDAARTPRRIPLAKAGLGRLNAARLADAQCFHEEIGSARPEDGSPYRFRMVVGTRQPTLATARVAGDAVEPLWTIDGHHEQGDGTVPRFASFPLGVEPDDLRQLRSGLRHGWLQGSAAVLDDLAGILTDQRIVYMDEPPDLPRQPGIELPELIALGEPLSIRARSRDDDLLLHATLTDESGALVGGDVVHNVGGGVYEVALQPPAAGVYTVGVHGADGEGIEPLADAVLVVDARDGG